MAGKAAPPGSEHLTETIALELRESLDGGVGRKWGVVILKEGMSANRRRYSRKAVEDTRLFEGKWCLIDHLTDAERQARPEGTLTRKAGKISDVHMVEGANGLESHATLTVVLPWVREALLNAHNEGITDWAGLSIDAHGRVQVVEAGGERVPTVVELVRANTVDLVTLPAAGGAVRHLLASDRGDEVMTPEEVQALVEASQAAMLTALQETLKATTASAVQEAITALREVDDEPVREGGMPPWLKKKTGKGGDEDDDPDDEDDVQESLLRGSPDRMVDELEDALLQVRQLREAAAAELTKIKQHATERMIDAGLEKLKGVPDNYAALTRERLQEAARTGQLDDAGVTRIVETARDVYASMVPNNPSGTPGGGIIVSRDEKFLAGVRGMFRGEDVAPAKGQAPVARFVSLREAFCTFTGENPLRLHPTAIMRSLRTNYDSAFSGLDQDHLREAMTTASWGDIFADVMHNEMLVHFGAQPQYNEWRQIVSRIDSTPDFQAQNVTRWGGYANLPSVAEAGPYTALSSPGDQRTSFVVGKFGGTEGITWEMVVNDDMGAIGEIPGRLGYAASRGLYEFVMDMATTDNPVLAYDSVTLYHLASHGNTGTNDLTVAGWDASERAVMAQVPYGHPANEVLGPRGKLKNVIIGRGQRLRARALFNPSAVLVASMTAPSAYDDVDPRAFADSGVQVIEYDGITNNDFYAQADPKLPGMNLMTVGFLGGRQAPETWVSQDPTQGSMWSNDQILFKIRYVYGGVIPDHRGWYRNQPAA